MSEPHLDQVVHIRFWNFYDLGIFDATPLAHDDFDVHPLLPGLFGRLVPGVWSAGSNGHVGNWQALRICRRPHEQLPGCDHYLYEAVFGRMMAQTVGKMFRAARPDDWQQFRTDGSQLPRATRTVSRMPLRAGAAHDIETIQTGGLL